MNKRRWLTQQTFICEACIAATMLFIVGAIPTLASAAAYEIETKTSMPHLRENLRYTDTRVHRCITGDVMPNYFPILDNSAFEGCNWSGGEQMGGSTLHLLTCPSSSGTAGAAIIQAHSKNIDGVLSVKLGGKNMTFSQRIHARYVGECDQ
ncbi:MAG: hypothetical protein ACR2P1_24810 [Pseudomonadales bacterium]